VDHLRLHEGLCLAEQVLLVAPEGPAAEAARRAAARPASAAPGLVLATPGSPARGPRILVGTPEMPELAAAAARLGLGREGDSLFWTSAPELGPFDLLAATLSDPELPGVPLSVLVATDLEAALPWIERAAPNAWPSVRVWRAGDLLAEGELDPDGSLRAGTLRRFEVERLAAADPVRRAPGIALAGEVDAELKGAYLEALSRVRASVLAEVDEARGAAPELCVVAFEHPEDLARATGRFELAVENPRTGAVAALVAPGLDDGGAAAARALVRALIGPPARAWVAEGFGVLAAGTWWGRELEPWVAGLASGGLVPSSAGEVLGDDAGLSVHLVAPLRAAFLGHWLAGLSGVERRGALAGLWSGARAIDLDAAWPAFLEHLAGLAVRHTEARAQDRAERSARFEARSFRRGVNLCAPLDVPPGVPPGALRGFGTRAAERSVQRLRWLGANSVAIVAQGLSFPGDPRAPFEPLSPHPALIDSDLALVTAMRHAAGRGLGVMLRPLVFETPSGHWAADHAEESEARAAVFFERYGRLLLHAALLAELGGAELLCVGSELPKATRSDPAGDPWIPDFTNLSPDRWRALIDRARGAFGGALTYAADPRGEAQRIGFWDALDLPGIDLYGSLTMPPGEPTRPDDSMEVSAQRIALRTAIKLGVDFGRPCLVIEIGFPSSAMGWQFTDETRGLPDVGEQTRALAALAQAFELEAPPRTQLGGLYLWNWSTDPEAGSDLDESYTFQNRPGERFVKRLFTDG
jgi:hypothetical protein